MKGLSDGPKDRANDNHMRLHRMVGILVFSFLRVGTGGLFQKRVREMTTRRKDSKNSNKRILTNIDGEKFLT
jgi:hypothetical protein